MSPCIYIGRYCIAERIPAAFLVFDLFIQSVPIFKEDNTFFAKHLQIYIFKILYHDENIGAISLNFMRLDLTRKITTIILYRIIQKIQYFKINLKDKSLFY